MGEYADVTVVIPAFNRAGLLGAALDSVAAQSTPPAAVVVIDDGSTDDTVEVARSHGVTVLETGGNQGSGPARNLGIEAAATGWVAFLDSDDVWHPDHLATLVGAAAGHVLVSSSGVTSAGAFLGNPTGEPLELTPMRLLLSSDLVVTSACMVRRDALVAEGMFRALRRAQDLDMWVRALSQGTGIVVPRTTVTYHEHEGQASRDGELMRACFAEIVDGLVDRGRLDPVKDVDRVYARVRWDDLRLTQREQGPLAAVRELGWFGRRPHTWRPLVSLLRLRRLRRHRASLST